MEIAQSILDTLRVIQNSSSVSDDIFNQIVTNSIALTTLDRCKDRSHLITGLAAAATKSSEIINTAQADVASLFVEAARHNYERENLVHCLQDVRLYGGIRIDKLCDAYAKQRDKLIAHLNTIGGGLPCIVDVNWKLDYCIKTNTNDSVGNCLYHVRLVTKKHGKLDHVQFTCTLHQLQDLIYKLRDAVRHVEKISHV